MEEKKQFSCGILTYEQWSNSIKGSIGSSRIRGEWLVNHWPEAKLFKIAEMYDVIIFQKAYFVDFMEVYKGIKILDICDPDWMGGRPVKQCIELCDAVTTSSQALADYIKTMTDKPVVFIDDRIDLDKFDIKKEHKGNARGVVWFGYHNNHSAIDTTLQTIKRLGLSLTVISDLPYFPSSGVEGIDKDWINENVKNIKFDKDTYLDEIVRGGDILINPTMNGGKWKFKSQNKTYIAWALGLPVARDSEELEKFIDEGERIEESNKRVKEVIGEHSTIQSVKQYKKLINELVQSKKE